MLPHTSATSHQTKTAFVCRPGRARACCDGGWVRCRNECSFDPKHATIGATAPESFPLKNQVPGISAATHSPNVLPIYGSSELLKGPQLRNVEHFPRTAPTGFQLSPVGSGGANPLIMLQKVAHLVRRCAVKSLQFRFRPAGFATQSPVPRGYNANFSPMAATEIVFGTALDFGLKRDIAARMLQFPDTLEQRPFLEFALRRLASGQLH